MPSDSSGPLPARQAARYEQAEGRRLLSAFRHRVRSHALYVWYIVRGRDLVEIVAVTRSVP
jgi:hypothetical protein